jgi:hypothetical protein
MCVIALTNICMTKEIVVSAPAPGLFSVPLTTVVLPVESCRGINVLVQEQRAELAAAVHKAACDLADDQLHWH